jgi:hypothetical protein
MITEHHEHIPDDFRVSVAEVSPWSRFPACPKCGYALGAGYRFLRCLAAVLGLNAQTYAYCKGDQNSTVRQPALNLATGELGAHEIRVPCFGLIDEHLHLKCGRCDFRWLMQCKPGSPIHVEHHTGSGA